MYGCRHASPLKWGFRLNGPFKPQLIIAIS